MTVLGGAAVYVVSKASKLRAYVAWRNEVRVFAFNSLHNVSVQNAGDGPLWLSHIAIEIPGLQIESFPINKRLEAGQLVTVETSAKPYEGMTLINHATRDEWVRALATLNSDVDSSCVTFIAFSEDDSGYQTFAQADREDPHQMPELTTSATLHYYDLEKQRPAELMLNVHGLLFVRRDCIHRLGLLTLERVTH
jgi:hypothetical protein